MNNHFSGKTQLVLVILLFISVNLRAHVLPVSNIKPSEMKVKSNEQNVIDKIASKTSLIEQSEVQVKSHFDRIVSNIDSTLFLDREKLKANISLLEEFVDTKVIPLWDVDRTLKLLVGKKTWKSLSDIQIQNLRNSFSHTLHRYVREGMNYYDGQRIKLINVTLNNKINKGLLAVELAPIYLPAFNIHFKITKVNKRWLLYDVMVEGISYVKMKKNQYRQIVRQDGVEGLMAYLNAKNDKPFKINKGNNNVKSKTENREVKVGQKLIN